MFNKKFNVLSGLGVICVVSSAQSFNLSAKQSLVDLFEDGSPYKIYAAIKVSSHSPNLEMSPEFCKLGRSMKTLKRAAQGGKTLGKYYWAQHLKEQGKASEAREIFESLAAEKQFLPALVKMDEIDASVVKKNPTLKSPFLAVFAAWSPYVKKVPGYKLLINLAQRFGS